MNDATLASADELQISAEANKRAHEEGYGYLDDRAFDSAVEDK